MVLPALLTFGALPAAAKPTPEVVAAAPARAGQPVLATAHVSAELSTLSAAPGDRVDVLLTMTVPPEGVPQTANPDAFSVMSLKTDADEGLWNFTDGCTVLSGPAPSGCSTGYAAQSANWFGGGISQPGVVRLLFRSTVAPDAEPGTYGFTLRGIPGTIPLEEVRADGVFTVLDPASGAP